MLMDGICIPLTMPFTREGGSYLRKLEYNVRRYSLTPATGFVALTGEGGGLSDEEAYDALRVIGAAAVAEKVLVAAIRRNTVRDALALATRAAEAQFDAVLLTAPPDWPEFTSRDGSDFPGERSAELDLFFRTVADASPLPVFLVSDSSAMGYRFPVDLVRDLATHPNIFGLFDFQLTPLRYAEIVAATANVRRELVVTTVFSAVTRRMLKRVAGGHMVDPGALSSGAMVSVAPFESAFKTRTKPVGFQVMAAGAIEGLVEMLGAGAAGTMPMLGPCVPQACYEIYAAFKDSDQALAEEKQERLREADRILRGLGDAGIKYACDLNGYYGGSVRLPRTELNSSQKSAVENLLAGLQN